MNRTQDIKSTQIEERDACAIIAFVDKRGQSTHANIVQTIDALRKMGHRSGDINGEGDGCGITTDLPRDIWARRLARNELSPHLAESNSFFVGHFLIPASAISPSSKKILSLARKLFSKNGAEILAEIVGNTRDEELGPRARIAAPLFWQIGGLITDQSPAASRKKLFSLQLELERELPEIHIASLSLDSVVFKVQGLPDMLHRVYPELRDQDMSSVMTLGHGRYSTNTLPTVERTQPFSLLGHNGEINTIEKLRSTGKTLGIAPVSGGSDSQDLNRVIEGLINQYELDILEAMEMVFPAIYSEVKNYPKDLQELYSFYRWFFPCSAQGPAAVLARSGDICLGSVDALGLRPLWFGESDYNYFLSSEKGVVALERHMSDPRPLAPGEKIAICGSRGKPAEVLNYWGIQKRLVRLFLSRPRTKSYLRALYLDIPAGKSTRKKQERSASNFWFDNSHGMARFNNPNFLGAFGWQQYDLAIRKQVAHTGREVIGSMGHTGPLAAFVPESLPNISDYCKENVAVVTNPAIDREREAEHFTTRTTLGSRPDIYGEKAIPPLALELKSPILFGEHAFVESIDKHQCREICRKNFTYLFEDVIDFFTCQQRDPKLVGFLDATFVPKDGVSARLKKLFVEAQMAIEQGAILLVLDDSQSFANDRVFIDPALAVSFLHDALITAGNRREISIIVKSAAIRNLHDVMFLLGLGADALYPYLLWAVAGNYADENHAISTVVDNTLAVLQKGMEKVMSTMGIHELCGYGRIFSAIALRSDLAGIIRLPTFCPSDTCGLGLTSLNEQAAKRYARAHDREELAIYREPTRNPKVGRILRDVAVGKTGYLEMAQKLEQIAEDLPTGVRHLLKAKPRAKTTRLTLDKVDISIGNHAMPLIIAAMSFGSQGENSFRAYAETAKKVNIVCMNGEGGEIPDMLGKYRKNRGQQIASGRFGVFIGLLNSADFLEIKIGQGAKPGEGGHLPGNKVSEIVAKARHCKQGITLISPSNHHDIYSIEDLSQIITELKTANPHAKISVKIPVTSGIGTIAVGVAKAGANILNISGFEGGTGAAREHAKRYVGLPAEIGVSEAHLALVESGLREGLEIWTDGGMRSGDDVLKMILLGANRVGLGTVALMGVGCISCKKCHLDQCPRGISTQIRTKEEAAAKDVKVFTPRILENEVENLARLLSAIGEELRMRVADLGETNLQSLVGRTDLLTQYKMLKQIDTSGILRAPVSLCGPENSRPQIVRKPLNYLTQLISNLTMDHFQKGDSLVHFSENGVQSTDRAVGTYLAGAFERTYGGGNSDKKAVLRFNSSVPGNGLCAFISPSIEAVVEGGSQDGAAKGSIGGILGVFKGENLLGQRVDGSTGKSFAYGAIGGLFIVQNMADSRACIRMSGADAIFGGRITAQVCDDLGNIASRAHLKGFAFEYMTGGRALVLGDPGPWLCSGMTGGVIYQCLYPEYDFTRESIQRRLAQSANVKIQAISKEGLSDIGELLKKYIVELEKGFQEREALAVSEFLRNARKRFVMITPRPLRPPSAE